MILKLSMFVCILSANISVWAQRSYEVQVTNYSGKRITYLYVAEYQSDNYTQESILKGCLNDGMDIQLQYPPINPKQCVFDMKTVYADGTEFIWDALDFCNHHFFTLQPRGFINIR